MSMGASGGTGGDYSKQLMQQTTARQLEVIDQAMADTKKQAAALAEAQPAVFKLLGYTPQGAPLNQSMIDTLLAGKEIDPSRYTVEATRGERPTDPGPKPKAYKFTGSNWGPNDDQAKAKADKAIAQWKEDKATFKHRLAAWEAKAGNTDLAPGYQQQLADATLQANLLRKLTAASRGELDPTSNAAIRAWEDTERNRMFKQLGPGWENSSAGMDFMARRAGATADIARSDLSGLLSQLQGYQANQTAIAGGNAASYLSGLTLPYSSYTDLLQVLPGAVQSSSQAFGAQVKQQGPSQFAQAAPGVGTAVGAAAAVAIIA